jgi:hypothetical protein
MAQDAGLIEGKVTDSSSTPIYGALVTVEGANGSRHTTVTDTEGAFRISSLAAGHYSLKISASGFSDWTASNVAASVTPEAKPLMAVLQVAPQVTSVTVTLPPEEIAAEQLSRQVKQRTLGVIPNYYVTYESNPAPLLPKQKFHLASKLLLDPATFAAVGITAGIQQAHNSYYQWGQGSEGYAKRFGAAYGTAAQNLLITSVVADSVLHQDPRYFYSGRGTKKQRAWYAFASAFRAKGDSGEWQPPYAGLIGAVASAEISNTYYPGERTQYSLLGRSLMFHFAGLVGLNFAEEFLLKKMTSHTPEAPSETDRTVLREGTPVPLIAADGLFKEGAENNRTVNFVLADDLTVRGKVVAKTGDVASGQVGQVTAAKVPGETASVTIERVTLRAGNVNVPLRSNQVRGASGLMQFKELPESGKIEVKLFVAEDVQFPEGQ